MHQFSRTEKQEETAAIKLWQLGSCLNPDTYQWGIPWPASLCLRSEVRAWLKSGWSERRRRSSETPASFLSRRLALCFVQWIQQSPRRASQACHQAGNRAEGKLAYETREALPPCAPRPAGHVPCRVLGAVSLQ